MNLSAETIVQTLQAANTLIGALAPALDSEALALVRADLTTIQ